MSNHRPAALRNPAPLYVAGLFSMGYADFYIFLMPLYCLSLGMSAGEVGLIVGARSALAVFLSIHVGTLMDRFGTRRVTLFFVWIGICLAPVFPLVPWFWPLLLLQIVNGGALSFAWSGSQTLIAQLAEGDAGYIGRFSFFARIGTAAAPLAAGLAWDFGGVWTAYLLGAGWGVLLTAALLRAPEAEVAPRGGQAAAPRFRPRDALPRLSDYVACFALMAIPAVAVTIAIMLLRNATNSVQYSLYIVYLDRIGLTGTVIGVLFAAIEIASGVGSLAAGRAMRFGDPRKTMLGGTVASILFICATPFLGGVFLLLLLAQNGARLVAGGGPADDVFGAGEGSRPLPPGFGRRAAPDREPPVVDHRPARHGCGCGFVGHDREFYHPGRGVAVDLRADRADHPSRRADPCGPGSARARLMMIV